MHRSEVWRIELQQDLAGLRRIRGTPHRLAGIEERAPGRGREGMNRKPRLAPTFGLRPIAIRLREFE